MREDADGEFHYGVPQIFNADIVLPAHRVKRTLGYWGTKASHQYANPLFVKLIRKVWSKCPKFHIFAEMFWNRSKKAALSGVISLAPRLPLLIHIAMNEQTQPLPRRTANSFLQHWYDKNNAQLPEGYTLVFPSTSHHTDLYTSPLQILNHPYVNETHVSKHVGSPALRYGLGAAAYISLMYFLPEVPMTYIGDQEGSTSIIDINTGKIISSTKDTSLSTQLKEYYRTCSALRASQKVLQCGKIKILKSKFSNKKNIEVEQIASFSRYLDENEIIVFAVNLSATESNFFIDLRDLEQEFIDRAVHFEEDSGYQVENLLVLGAQRQHFAWHELFYDPQHVKLAPYSFLCWKATKLPKSSPAQRIVFQDSVLRLRATLANHDLVINDPTHNYFYHSLYSSLDSKANFKRCLQMFQDKMLYSDATDLAKLVQSALYHICTIKASSVEETNALQSKIFTYLLSISTEHITAPDDSGRRSSQGQIDTNTAQSLARQVVQHNALGPIVFLTPEIAPWSTIGGIGVMVDELTQDLAKLGLDVKVISPYYNYNRDGKTAYLKSDGIEWLRNLVTLVGYESVEVGVHFVKRNDVDYYFMHNWKYFPAPYHTGSPEHQLKMVVLMAKASLELMCQERILPAVCITNDWFTALASGYARCGEFGSVFNGVTFFHLIHNLEEGYQGLIYPDVTDMLKNVHRLPEHYVVDTVGAPTVISTSRCALLTSDQWGTVSPSYRADLLKGNPYSHLLKRFPVPFAHCNGVRVQKRLERLATLAVSHEEAKAALQRKYFGREDPSMPIFSFVGRITSQKGVHLILNAVESLMQSTNNKVMVLIGGMASKSDPYAAHCAWQMNVLRRTYPDNFWADPNAFFTDGALVNFGSDFGLMPSLFEPSGVVQQEYFVAGTPVVAFSTGGLKDTVFEFDGKTGNGFIFLAHQHADFVYAVQRALAVYNNSNSYAQLRINARASVLDALVVARAWGRQFCKIRNRIWPEAGLFKDADAEDGNNTTKL